METAEIKRRWLEFFSARDHTVVPSASLLLDDPNLLFVNAGMAEREHELHRMVGERTGIQIDVAAPAVDAAAVGLVRGAAI